MAPSLERPDPPFLQIAAHIREQILSGELREGDTVPSSRQICEQWRVAIATASKALSVLRNEGYTRAIPGVGTVVRTSETLRHAPRGRLVARRRDGRIYPPGDRVTILAAELVTAPPHVADAIAVRKGTQVIRRHRLTSRHSRPVSLSTSWFDAAVAEAAPLLLSMDRVVGGTTAYVEEQTGRAVTAGRDQVTARQATGSEAADLGLPAGFRCCTAGPGSTTRQAPSLSSVNSSPCRAGGPHPTMNWPLTWTTGRPGLPGWVDDDHDPAVERLAARRVGRGRIG